MIDNIIENLITESNNANTVKIDTCSTYEMVITLE